MSVYEAVPASESGAEPAIELADVVAPRTTPYVQPPVSPQPHFGVSEVMVPSIDPADTTADTSLASSFDPSGPPRHLLSETELAGDKSASLSFAGDFDSSISFLKS